ncbi:pre-peptidase C-terminal domain-containing protein [Microbulbifer aggregans]|uniref:pre-peptidase C-terminal domain-containing protein n=1 Tax=Microbulbifer aggregans TaxID=1769779 RepID=UPI00299D67A1|nr:pre-peptidase C-terminal domain-containing protein [Microbulbifer aggregans]
MKTSSLRIAAGAAAMMGLASLTAQASTQYHRLSWDADPSSTAVIGFSPSGTSTSPTVKYGTSTNEASWSTVSVSTSRTFDSSLQSSFVRLANLPANSPIYYRVCDQDGCGDRFWFRTAPTDNSPFVAVAGGDTRTGWTNRQQGNRLVAKLRPLFIMHGGDFTNANTASEVRSWLSDWELTYSSDTIDGVAYKRIYPLLPTHGNHEDGDYSTVCKVFGIDPNNDGSCSPDDTYGAVRVSPLFRAYTLNSQFQNSGWSSYASRMNSWLSSDLAGAGQQAVWRVAQYHKPMFPHYSGKSDNWTLFDWWSDLFYQQGMNLVVESDTHMNKLTEALKPDTNGYNAVIDGGTVFVGEGSWGAPARSANDPKAWTIDLASIQQFKVLTVTADSLQVRTAQFDSSAGTLTREQRSSNPTLLPSNVNWWSANTVGAVMTLTQSAAGRSIIEGSDSGGPCTDCPTDEAIALANGVPASGLAAGQGEELMYQLNVPAGASNLSFTITGGSGDADLYVKPGAQPTTSDYDCRPYKSGNEETCSYTSPQAASYFVTLRGYSSFSGVTLTGSYSEDGGSGSEPGSFSESNLSGSQGAWQHFSIEVPAGTGSLNVAISGGSGDADLYVRAASQPTNTSYDCRPYKNGNEESCSVSSPQAGTWYLSLKGYSAYSGVALQADWN